MRRSDQCGVYQPARCDGNPICTTHGHTFSRGALIVVARVDFHIGGATSSSPGRLACSSSSVAPERRPNRVIAAARREGADRFGEVGRHHTAEVAALRGGAHPRTPADSRAENYGRRLDPPRELRELVPAGLSMLSGSAGSRQAAQ
jgi:hypothetical protein